MKKLISLVTFIVISISTIYAQNKLESSGNAGVGTSSPSTLFQVSKSHGTALSPSLITSNDISGVRFTNLSTTSNAGVVLNFQLGASGTSHAAIAVTRPSADHNSIHFFTENANTIAERMTISSSGNIGIGNTNPSQRLDLLTTERAVGRFLGSNSTDSYFTIGNTSSGLAKLVLDGQNGDATGGDYATIYNVNSTNSVDRHLRFQTNATDRMAIDGNGNVGIGTTTPQSKLAVDGQIRATEVKVLADISVPDYVFEPDYELRTLKETKAYIEEHKHLPEIPSAKEIGENGIDLGDMNMRLLKKVEELTLYQIELLEKLEEQNKLLLEQQRRIEKLEDK